MPEHPDSLDYSDPPLEGVSLCRPQTPAAENIMRDVISTALKELLELGFLYVSRRIDLSRILALASEAYTPEKLQDEFTYRPWVPYSQNRGYTTGERQIRYYAGMGTQALGTPPREMNLTFILPTIHTWCARCKEVVLHDSIPHIECSPYHLNPDAVKEPPGFKTYLLNYQCQKCKGPPMTFMFRRELLKIQLCGRSTPHIPLAPGEIPKNVRDIYKDAQAAAACNDIPGAFYHWRTLMEHHMKAVAKIAMAHKIEGDELCAR